jgi:general stress protein 26
MEFEVKKRKILDVMSKHKLAVISTVAFNKPEAALIGFNHTADLQLMFGTFISFRKYNNIKNNPHVAFVIGWQDSITVQYEGKAEELKDAELAEYKEKYLEKFPNARKYINNSEERFFKVTPTWLRYTDLSGPTEEVIEIKF